MTSARLSRGEPRHSRLSRLSNYDRTANMYFCCRIFLCDTCRGVARPFAISDTTNADVGDIHGRYLLLCFNRQHLFLSIRSARKVTPARIHDIHTCIQRSPTSAISKTRGAKRASLRKRAYFTRRVYRAKINVTVSGRIGPRLNIVHRAIDSLGESRARDTNAAGIRAR